VGSGSGGERPDSLALVQRGSWLTYLRSTHQASHARLARLATHQRWIRYQKPFTCTPHTPHTPHERVFGWVGIGWEKGGKNKEMEEQATATVKQHTKDFLRDSDSTYLGSGTVKTLQIEDQEEAGRLVMEATAE